MIDVDLNQVAIPLRFPELFAREAPAAVEIGSGKGKLLLELAAARPELNLLGVERAAKYHTLVCERAARRGLANVRMLRTTAEDLLFRLLAPGSVGTFLIAFPDPWPKKRHHKRRLFTPRVVAALAAALAPSGLLLVKSDHISYAEVIRLALDQAPELVWAEPEAAWAGLPESGFERKYLAEGRAIHRFAMQKRP